MKELKTTLERFNTYLTSAGDEDLTTIFSEYGDNKAKFKHDFAELTLKESPDLNDLIKKILKNSTIHERQWGRFIGAPITFYDFFNELHLLTQKGNKKLSNLFEKTDLKLKRNWDNLLLALVLGTIGIVFLTPTISGGFSVIREIVAAAAFVPIASIVYSFGVFIYSIYDSIVNKKKMVFKERFRDNFFDMASFALKLTAYSLLLVTAAYLGSPIIFSLIVVAASLGIVKQLVSFIHLVTKIMKVNNERSVKDEMTLAIQQERTRLDFDFLKNRNALIINIVAALFITAIVVASFFIPGGIFVSIGVIVALIVVEFLKSRAQDYNVSKMSEQLNSKFEKLEIADIENQDLKPAPSDTVTHELPPDVAPSDKHYPALFTIPPIAQQKDASDKPNIKFH